jgi:hypothetical protein
MTHFRTKFHKPSSAGSLIIDSKLKATQNIRMATMLIFCNLISECRTHFTLSHVNHVVNKRQNMSE